MVIPFNLGLSNDARIYDKYGILHYVRAIIKNYVAI